MDTGIRVLSLEAIGMVHGGASLAQPIDNPQSEYGRTLNDGAQLLNNIGSALGIWFYDITHRAM